MTPLVSLIAIPKWQMKNLRFQRSSQFQLNSFSFPIVIEYSTAKYILKIYNLESGLDD